MDIEPIPYPWEQQSGESARAYQAFCLYRDRFPNTSIRAVAQELEKNSRTIAEWSSVHRWTERSQAWVAETDRRRREAFIKENTEASRQIAVELAALRRVLTVVPQTLLQRLRDHPDKVMEELAKQSTMSLLDVSIQVARVFGTLVVQERLARGQTTSHVAISGVPSEVQASLASDEERLAAVFAANESAGILPPIPIAHPNGDA